MFITTQILEFLVMMSLIAIRCLDEMKHKDLEVYKLQNCVKQLQREKMLLDEQDKRNKITIDAIKQEVGFTYFMFSYSMHSEWL